MTFSQFSKISALALFMLFAGCKSRPFTPYQISEPFMVPEIGTIATKGVGDSLLMQGTRHAVRPTLVVLKNDGLSGIDLPKGKYKFGSENSERIQFIGNGKDVYFYKDKKAICLNKNECGFSTLEYSMEGIFRESADSFQQKLLYNGKIGSKITLSYREFDNNMARPAFSNEVSYDLSESSILGYKGARIEVINATNTEITYKFLSGFNN
jgi:hypothetical protein